MGYFVIATKHWCDHDINLNTYSAESLEDGIISYMLDWDFFADELYVDDPDEYYNRVLKSVKETFGNVEKALYFYTEKRELTIEYEFLGQVQVKVD